MIEIDGSYLEGGGQILRTALSLSAICNKPFIINKIRANRPKPGLQPQHLAAVNAIAKICSAKVQGNSINSTKIAFQPGKIIPGRYIFDIGTAGSAVLLSQALIPPLMFCEEESIVLIRGGTHVIKSPSFEYFEKCFIPNIRKMGVDVKAELKRPGFYPEGGGEIELQIKPSKLRSYDFCERGGCLKVRVFLLSAGLPAHVLEREESVIKECFGSAADIIKKQITGAASKGNSITFIGEYENYSIGVDVLGKVGKPAESVAKEALALYEKERSHNAVDYNMVDQLLLYIALAGGGKIKYHELSSHAQTNIYTISKISGILPSINAERKEIVV